MILSVNMKDKERLLVSAFTPRVELIALLTVEASLPALEMWGDFFGFGEAFNFLGGVVSSPIFPNRYLQDEESEMCYFLSMRG